MKTEAQKEKDREYSRKYRKDHKKWKYESNKKYVPNQREYLRKVRLMAINSLGGKCVRCGFSDIRALQIDHIKGSGSRERKERNYKGNFHMHVIKSFLNNENKYQLLCANCNWIKRHENNETKKVEVKKNRLKNGQHI